ncbi:hypothetical protein [uncultured Thiodictyon sp.]|uniref:hypothetical protein n=1 Tax=uncultured Thiodictyon sp. TaxID=1846217 RepID=UPI0025E7B1E6|nr:hypothetical protein [uncultured Thiodictyon sp.]
MLKPSPISQSERTRILSVLLSTGEHPDTSIGETALGALLQHQMRSRVLNALRDEGIELPKRLVEIEQSLSDNGIETFAELFGDPAPPICVLRAVHRHAKRLMALGPEEFPTDLARVIYALCELSATQADAGTRSGRATLGRWCLAQTWLDDATRNMVRKRLATA